MSRILVIDDEAALGENIQRMLRLPGVSVAITTDPSKGLADALASPPNLVLLDVRMPGMSGGNSSRACCSVVAMLDCAS